MPARNRGDELPVYTPIDIGAPVAPFSANETNYDTLALIRTYIAERIEAQYKDFNAFEIALSGPVAQRYAELERQIIRRQSVYDELVVIQQAIESAVQKVDMKYKEA